MKLSIFGFTFFEKRPWGWMIKLWHSKRFWIKFLYVPRRTSLQHHEYRTEYHIGISKIAPGDRHRMSKGLFFEVATGDPDEADIIRHDDDFGRA